MAEVTFRGYLKRTLPAWLLGTWGGRYLYSFGLVLDAIMQGATDATKARMPYPTGPADALARIGQDSALERYPADTDATFRARLQARFPTWQKAGSEQAVVGQLNAFGFANVSVYTAQEWYPGDADWSRFWVVIDPTHGWTWPIWGNFNWNSFTWSATTSPTGQILDLPASLRRLVRRFKSAHERCDYIVIIADAGAPVWNHNMNWNSFTWHPSSTSGIAIIQG